MLDPLHARIFYVASDGRCRMTSPMTLLGEAKETGDQLRDRVLALTTEFVRSRWYRMEVSTPLVGEYGRFSGGYHRLLATR